MDRWIREAGKPCGVYGISLPVDHAKDDEVVRLLNQSRFVFFRDTVSLEIARLHGIKASIMEFGPDAAFAVDIRNDQATKQFLSENGLEEEKFLRVSPKYRRTPYWEIPEKNRPFGSSG